MNKRFYFPLLLVLFIFTAMGLSTRAWAAPNAQFTPFPTPTPGADGRIIYIADTNDSAWRIAAIFGISIDDLRKLNKWGDNPIIRPGDAILLGMAGPAQVTPTLGPSATPEPLLPTPSPLPGWGNLCVMLYNDENGDSLRQEEEPSIPDGAISVTERYGAASKTGKTDNSADPICFEVLPEGMYNVSVAVPDGYNSTTETFGAVELKAGDTVIMDFGAQPNAATAITSPVLPVENGLSPTLGILGGLLLLGGVGLGVFAGRLMNAKNASR